MEETSTCKKHVQESFRVPLIWDRAMLSLVSQCDREPAFQETDAGASASSPVKADLKQKAICTVLSYDPA